MHTFSMRLLQAGAGSPDAASHERGDPWSSLLTSGGEATMGDCLLPPLAFTAMTQPCREVRFDPIL